MLRYRTGELEKHQIPLPARRDGSEVTHKHEQPECSKERARRRLVTVDWTPAEKAHL